MGRIFPVANWAGASSLLNGLAAYYPLGEASGNRADSLGANPLTPTGSPGNAAGKVGNAIALDGTAKYVECADSAALDFTTAMSMSVWVYTTALANNACVVSKWAYATDGAWALVAVALTTALRLNVAATPTDGGSNYATLAAALTVGGWAHFTVVYDGAQTGNAARLKIYKDGTAQTLSFAGTIPATLQNSASVLRVGAWSGSLTRYWNGRVDELGLWNRALTTGEIAALYNGGAGVTYPF